MKGVKEIKVDKTAAVSATKPSADTGYKVSFKINSGKFVRKLLEKEEWIAGIAKEEYGLDINARSEKADVVSSVNNHEQRKRCQKMASALEKIIKDKEKGLPVSAQTLKAHMESKATDDNRPTLEGYLNSGSKDGGPAHKLTTTAFFKKRPELVAAVKSIFDIEIDLVPEKKNEVVMTASDRDTHAEQTMAQGLMVLQALVQQERDEIPTTIYTACDFARSVSKRTPTYWTIDNRIARMKQDGPFVIPPWSHRYKAPVQQQTPKAVEPVATKRNKSAEKEIRPDPRQEVIYTEGMVIGGDASHVINAYQLPGSKQICVEYTWLAMEAEKSPDTVFDKSFFEATKKCGGDPHKAFDAYNEALVDLYGTQLQNPNFNKDTYKPGLTVRFTYTPVDKTKPQDVDADFDKQPEFDVAILPSMVKVNHDMSFQQADNYFDEKNPVDKALGQIYDFFDTQNLVQAPKGKDKHSLHSYESIITSADIVARQALREKVAKKNIGALFKAPRPEKDKKKKNSAKAAMDEFEQSFTTMHVVTDEEAQDALKGKPNYDRQTSFMSTAAVQHSGVVAEKCRFFAGNGTDVGILNASAIRYKLATGNDFLDTNDDWNNLAKVHHHLAAKGKRLKCTMAA